jgi:Inorganic Pyrophosphatase
MSFKLLSQQLEEERAKTASTVKEALLERLVRLAATDVPGTPRLVMRHRSPEELASLQHAVEGTFGRFEGPAKARVHGVLEKVPHAGVRKALQSGADMMIENPEMIPMQAVPVPGVSLGYLAAKKGIEKGLDRLAPLHKAAFATSPYSGPLNPVIESGASFQNSAPIPSLRAPVARPKVAEEKKFKLQGETSFQGLDVAIENRKGSVRKGVDKDGKPWRTEMKFPYGFIRGSKGADGEEVDAYVGPKKDATHAFVVHQRKEDGKTYDEDKVMLGFGSEEEARKAYLAHYNDPKFLGPIKEVMMERFKKLVSSGKRLIKISAGAPTRGGFMMASDMNPAPVNDLSAPLRKVSDFLPDYIPADEGQGFKKSKFAKALERERTKTVRIFNGDHYQYLLDKQADISPTSPLGDGGGNPHRYPSWQGRAPINGLAAPLVKKAEGGWEFGYYGSGPGGPVNEAGFRQASNATPAPVNDLKKPVIKRAFMVASSPAAARNIGKAPKLSAPGPSISQIAKPKGMGSSLPGTLKTTIGGYEGAKIP